jgi:hypothetical protein
MCVIQFKKGHGNLLSCCYIRSLKIWTLIQIVELGTWEGLIEYIAEKGKEQSMIDIH